MHGIETIQRLNKAAAERHAEKLAKANHTALPGRHPSSIGDKGSDPLNKARIAMKDVGVESMNDYHAEK